MQRVTGLRQHYISGASVRARYQSCLIGWPQIVPKNDCALVLRRDRLLYLGAPAFEPGYHAKEGLAISDVSSGYEVIELSGAGVVDQLRRGGELRLDQPSASVARLLFRTEVILYRVSEATFRMHVPRPALSCVVGYLRDG
ncbi:MAG: hypothetical protein AAF755_14865 [Pseudomonadota bacterium]